MSKAYNINVDVRHILDALFLVEYVNQVPMPFLLPFSYGHSYKRYPK